MSIAPWEFVLRGAVIYFVLLILIRVAGKRTVGEFTPFDLVVVLLISEATQGGLTAGDESVAGTLVACTTLVALNFAIGFVTARSRTVDRMIEGEPVVLVRNGEVFRKALLRNNLPESDLDEALRANGARSLGEVALAMLETNGRISIVKREDAES